MSEEAPAIDNYGWVLFLGLVMPSLWIDGDNVITSVLEADIYGMIDNCITQGADSI